MFQGLRTVIYKVKKEDLDKAKEWYSKLLNKAPYFDELFYVGFSVGGFELGLDPSDEKIVFGSSPISYWGVSNIESTLNSCLKLEATEESDIQEVGHDIKVATIRDPFGNLLGLIENPGFKNES